MDDSLADRLRRVIEGKSQAEVARRTGVARNSVSRYLMGRKIPAEFCQALVEEFDVNPEWLLTGEGLPYRSEVRPEVSSTASDLLDLMTSLNAIVKMRLGSIVGNDHREKLRALSDAADNYQELLKKVNQQFRPLFDSLLKTFREAVDARDFLLAERVCKSLRDISRICPSPENNYKLSDQEGRFEYLRGNHEKAAECTRKAFWELLVNEHASSTDKMEAAHALAITLAMLCRQKEAHGILVAGLSLGVSNQSDPVYANLLFTKYIFECELGQLSEALPGLLKTFHRLPKIDQDTNGQVLAQFLIYAGAVPLKERILADREGECHSDFQLATTGIQVLQVACFNEDSDELALARSVYADALRHGPPMWCEVCDLHSSLLLEALNAPKTKLLDDLNKAPVMSQMLDAKLAQSQIGVEVIRSQIARIAGDLKNAKLACKRASQALEVLSPNTTMPVMLLAQHFKNVLELYPASSKSAQTASQRAHALSFFADRVASGYALFEPYYQSQG